MLKHFGFSTSDSFRRRTDYTQRNMPAGTGRYCFDTRNCSTLPALTEHINAAAAVIVHMLLTF